MPLQVKKRSSITPANQGAARVVAIAVRNSGKESSGPHYRIFPSWALCSRCRMSSGRSFRLIVICSTTCPLLARPYSSELRHFTFQRKHVPHLAVVILRPEMPVRGTADQLGDHPNPAAFPDDRSFQHDIHAQSSGDFRHRFLRIFEAHYRGVRDHAEFVDTRKASDKGVGDSYPEDYAYPGYTPP
jgi:hypothetical protein